MNGHASAVVVQEQRHQSISSQRKERGRRRSSFTSAHEKDHRQKQHLQPQTNRRDSSQSARVTRRRSMDDSHHSCDSNAANNIGRSFRSMRSDELLPERLSHALDRSSKSIGQLESLAQAILVAEEDNDLGQDIHAAVEKLPTHLLDPSQARLKMAW